MASTWSVASESILQAIGSTPLVRLKHVAGADAADVVVKLEFYNPTGSYKDRMALAMIEGAEARGALKPGMRVVEFTGGSTGSSLAIVCAVKGYRFVPVSSDAFAKEKLDTMRAFGAELKWSTATAEELRPICSFGCAPPSIASAKSPARTGPISFTTQMRSRDTWVSAASWSSKPAARCTPSAVRSVRAGCWPVSRRR